MGDSLIDLIKILRYTVNFISQHPEFFFSRSYLSYLLDAYLTLFAFNDNGAHEFDATQIIKENLHEPNSKNNTNTPNKSNDNSIENNN